ncbi:hypothetical protein VTN02DRAFT_1035 [Thermoascus thermophilus]
MPTKSARRREGKKGAGRRTDDGSSWRHSAYRPRFDSSASVLTAAGPTGSSVFF